MKRLPLLISILVHAALFLLAAVRLREVVVHVAPRESGIVMSLITAPPAEAETQAPPDDSVLPPSEPTVEIPRPAADSPRPSVAFAPVRVFVPAANSLPPVLLPPTLVTGASSAHVAANLAKAVGLKAQEAVSEPATAGSLADARPDFLSNPAPVYPEAAKRAGEQGVVILDVMVGTDGLPETVEIASSSGYASLDESARSAAEHYRFRPAMANGVRLRSHVRFPICFQLEG